MSFLIKNTAIYTLSHKVYNNVFNNNVYNCLGPSILINQTRNYAARKGYREKKKKQKVKTEEVKVGFIPHNQRDREKFLAERPTRKFNDSWKAVPKDDVYVAKYYKWKVYDFIEAVDCHRETHHPEIYNQPSAKLHLTIELNMIGEKKNKFLDNFTNIVAIPHKFALEEERSVVVFSKDQQTQEEAKNAGAQLVGGQELVKEFQNGNLSIHDFQYIVAHPNILPELVVLRGLMKRKFPNVKSGTLEVNLVEAVHRFKNGIQYSGFKDEFEKDFGSIETVIGTLDMDPKHLEGNFDKVINSVHALKPKRPGPFITRCLLWSPPSREKFKIDYEKYLKIFEEKQEEETTEIMEQKQVLNGGVAT